MSHASKDEAAELETNFQETAREYYDRMGVRLEVDETIEETTTRLLREGQAQLQVLIDMQQPFACHREAEGGYTCADTHELEDVRAQLREAAELLKSCQVDLRGGLYRGILHDRIATFLETLQ